MLVYKAYIHSIAKYTTSKIYFSEKYGIGNEEIWKKNYLLPGLVTSDTKTRIFQYKILNNILYLTDRLYKMQKVDLPLYNLCHIGERETGYLIYSFPE